MESESKAYRLLLVIFFASLALVVIATAVSGAGRRRVEMIPTDTLQADPVILADDNRYCWVPNGSIYHLDAACLKNSDTVVRGSRAEAITAGKLRLCKICAKEMS